MAVEAVGAVLFFGDGATLRIFDMSVPETPVFVSEVAVAGAIQDIEADGSTVFIAAEYGGLEIVDISSIGSPSRIGGLATRGRALDVAVDGSIAYLADYSGGLRIIEVSDPATPIEIGSYDVGNVEGVWAGNGYAYIGCNTQGLRVIDVSDPKNPVQVGSVVTTHAARKLTVAGGLAYVCIRGLEIVDVGDPTSPSLVGLLERSHSAQDLLVDHDTVYLVDIVYGLRIIDAKKPTGCPFSLMTRIRCQRLPGLWPFQASSNTTK